MMALLPWIGFVLLQALVLVAAIGFYVHKRRGSYYGALYVPVIGFAIAAGVMGGDDWIAALVMQSLLSLSFNFHISSSKREDERK